MVPERTASEVAREIHVYETVFIDAFVENFEQTDISLAEIYILAEWLVRGIVRTAAGGFNNRSQEILTNVVQEQYLNLLAYLVKTGKILKKTVPEFDRYIRENLSARRKIYDQFNEKGLNSLEIATAALPYIVMKEPSTEEAQHQLTTTATIIKHWMEGSLRELGALA